MNMNQKEFAENSQNIMMSEFDKQQPDNVEEKVWEHLCSYRHQKIHKEQAVSIKAPAYEKLFVWNKGSYVNVIASAYETLCLSGTRVVKSM